MLTSARDALLFLLIAASLFGCAVVLWPFLPALTGVALIAMLTRAPFEWLRRKLRNRTVAAGVAVMFVTLCIIVPVVLAGHFLADNVVNAVSLLRSPETARRVHSALDGLRSELGRRGLPVPKLDLNSTADNASGPIASGVVSLLGGSVTTVTQIVLMLFLLFFWYRGADSLVSRARRVLPFNAVERRFLGGTVRRTVRAVVAGRVAVAAIQALLAWITFLLLGIPAASLLATVTFVCCVLPAVGAFFVWVPVTVYLLLIHAWTRAIILACVGMFVLSTVDNVLQAVISGTQARMTTVEMFLSVVGGVWVLGIPGFVIGPVIWVAAAGLLTIWNHRQKYPPGVLTSS